MSDSESTASDTSQPLDFTFGIEIEHLFGIKQDEVANRPEHAWLRPEQCPVDIEGVGAPLDGPLAKHSRQKLAQVALRQAAKIIRRKEPELEVWLTPDPDVDDDEQDPYRRWKLTTEDAVPVPDDTAKLSAWSEDNDEIHLGDFKDWSLAGLELISRPLAAPDTTATDLDSDGLKELKSHLAAIPRNLEPERPYFFTTGPGMGSVHVHVGRKPEDDGTQVGLPIEFVQHLAFICMAFEDTITLLHHPERHSYQGTKIFKYGKSNRDVVREEGRLYHRCTLGGEYSCEKAFMGIFRAEDRQLLDGCLNMRPDFNDKPDRVPVRERFVNFTSALDAVEGGYVKRTVEFRQHHGTLSADDVCEWVFFVSALARTADRKRREEPAEDATLPDFVNDADGKYKVVEQERDDLEKEAKKYTSLFVPGKKRSLEELFDLLELPVERRKYWWAHAEANRKLWAEKYRGKSSCEPPCDNVLERDSEGWGDDELVCPEYDDQTRSKSPAPGSKRPRDDEDDGEDEEDGAHRPTKQAKAGQ
ncbi:hypothetical protein H2200_011167 [Cladophialophora chaetospira]|uniref:Uncharacterized protein n=1 Tax=Cladophialophora chaetospira TaxID=386627 RepID=A0AA38X063_9EURO|nr:hypothetical protein H2200_011167 [Cladophialophora chaetospira]